VGGQQERVVDNHCGVEQIQRFLRRHRHDPVAGEPGEVGLPQAAGHIAGLIPQSPAE
jgi:hypothetical protein